MAGSGKLQALWDLFADGRTLRPADATGIGMAEATARQYFAEWKRIGAIEESHRDGKTPFYRAAVAASEAPREQRPRIAADDDRDHRQRAWDLLREKGEVTVADFEAVGIFRKTAEHLLRHWRESGAVAFVRREGKRKFFRPAMEQEVAPEFTRLDAKLAPRETAALNLWTAARMLKTFSARDLAAHATTSTRAVSIEEASRFARMLLRGEYVRVQRKARPSEEIEARYRLIRDTGPKPPVEKRIRAVWDDNLGNYVHLPEHVQ